MDDQPDVVKNQGMTTNERCDATPPWPTTLTDDPTEKGQGRAESASVVFAHLDYYRIFVPCLSWRAEIFKVSQPVTDVRTTSYYDVVHAT